MANSGFTVRWLRPGDRLILGCLCGAVSAFARDDLISLLDAGAPLHLIGLRLRCTRCGQRPSNARFDWQRD